MPDPAMLLLLFAAGVVLLVLEIFIPSHGVLCVAGLGFLAWAVATTFEQFGNDAGLLSLLTCLVLLPVFAFVSIKFWRRTPVGRRIAPPNPIASPTDTSVPVAEMNALIGQTGRTLSALRPVGSCEFNGRRISCLTEFGTMAAGVTVVGVRVRNGNLVVAPAEGAPQV